MTDMTDYQKALSRALQMLGQERRYAKQQIAEIASVAVSTVTITAPDSTKVQIDEGKLVRELESMISWTIGQEFVMDSNENHVDWLPSRRSEIEWRFWDRYKRYISEKSKPLSRTAVDSIDSVTDKVLSRLEDPTRAGAWDRRGMIVGQVQSGKTANFVGLICKAADAGYRIIVVLAGVHENLRSQTQMRVEEGFLGYSSAEATSSYQINQRYGVGTLVTDYNTPTISLTGYRRDFSRAAAAGLNVSPFVNDPVILVVKKNKTILSNLLLWLAGYAQSDPDDPKKKRPLPDSALLVIDDEADHSSINTKEIPKDPDTGELLDDYDVTAINGKIRQLLSLFAKSAYVGYTATPFANIFVHPHDHSSSGSVGRPPADIFIPYGEGVFPRSFILSLPEPSNYVGPNRIFGIDDEGPTGISIPLVREVDDSEQYIPRKHKSNFVPTGLPPSLNQAIRAFILTCAARMHRGDRTEHNSMLIHVTRFIAVQHHLRELIEAELKDIVQRIRYGDGAAANQIMADLRELWEKDFEPTTQTVISEIPDPSVVSANWNAIEPLLSSAAQKIVVKRISGGSEDVLDYQRSPAGANVIAVGGDKLSRGLTLEGLSVSYFLRPSKMYDTLMQMGRWFGYRPGYLDLCRLYTTSELISWYRHIATASAELRSEFETMADAELTPMDYGLRVQSHPNGLLITSMVKMRESVTLAASYDGRICETIIFRTTQNFAEENLGATNRLLAKMPRISQPEGELNYVWSNLPASVILDFLREYKTHPHAPEVNSALLAHYIAQKVSHDGQLSSWTIVLLSSEAAGARQTERFPYPVRLAKRSNETPAESSTKYSIKRLLSPRHEQFGLAAESIAVALEETKREWTNRPLEKRKPEAPQVPSGPSLRKQRSMEKGLLLLYPLDPTFAKLNHDTPIVGMGMSFPGDRLNPTNAIEYEANLVYIGRELEDEDYD
jgi:hypothetical protein